MPGVVLAAPRAEPGTSGAIPGLLIPGLFTPPPSALRLIDAEVQGTSVGPADVQGMALDGMVFGPGAGSAVASDDIGFPVL